MNVLFQALRIADVLLMFAVLLVCAFVALSCVCRINAARVTPWRISLTQAMYIGFGFWAMSTVVEVLTGLESASLCHLGAGMAIMLHLYLTYPQWRGEDLVGDLAHWEDGHADPTRS